MKIRGKQDAPATVPKPFFPHHVETHTATEAYENVLADVGCNVPMLDDHDKRVIAETRAERQVSRAANRVYRGYPIRKTTSVAGKTIPKYTDPPIGIPTATACPTSGN